MKRPTSGISLCQSGCPRAEQINAAGSVAKLIPICLRLDETGGCSWEESGLKKMIASHRTPATLLMTTGGLLIVCAAAIPFFLHGEIPAGFKIAATIMSVVGLPLFVGGACVYSRGNGYPTWLGLAAITIMGLFIRMLLPDRHPNVDDSD